MTQPHPVGVEPLTLPSPFVIADLVGDAGIGLDNSCDEWGEGNGC